MKIVASAHARRARAARRSGPRPDRRRTQRAGHDVRRASWSTHDVEPPIDALDAKHRISSSTSPSRSRGKSALESNVAALLNLLDLRYTGSSPAGLAARRRQEPHEEDAARFTGFRRRSSRRCFAARSTAAGDLKFPLIVKPPQEDASLGITRRRSSTTSRSSSSSIGALQAEYQQPVLVEEFIDGREFYVGVLGNAQRRGAAGDRDGFHRLSGGQAEDRELGSEVGRRRRRERAPSTRERSRSSRRVSTKSSPSECRRSRSTRSRRCGCATTRASTCACRRAGEIYVIEVNPNCYLERESEFARAAKEQGWSIRRCSSGSSSWRWRGTRGNTHKQRSRRERRLLCFPTLGQDYWRFLAPLRADFFAPFLAPLLRTLLCLFHCHGTNLQFWRFLLSAESPVTRRDNSIRAEALLPLLHAPPRRCMKLERRESLLRYHVG